MEEYGKKTVLELQALLKEKGLRSHGRKAELLQRLEAWDNMVTSSSMPPPLPPPPAVPAPPWPSASNFRSLTQNMQDKLPHLTRQSFEQYVLYRQTFDKAPNNDINAMKKGALLSEEKVRGMSYCQENNLHFFVGAVEAAM